MRIGIFDSGLGGLTVLREALRVLPDESYLYCADTANVPYGTKDREEVRQCIFDCIAQMVEQGIKALVIACNTATSIAVAELRKVYNFPILGMEPAVKPALGKSNGKRVLVFATQLCLKEEKFKNLVSSLDSYNIVDSLPLPGLVTFAESLQFERSVVMPYLSGELSPFDPEKYGTVVLGCTHFPLYRDMVSELFPEGTEIIDGSGGTVRHLAKVLSDRGLLETGGKGSVLYMTSSEGLVGPERFETCLDRLDTIL